MNDRPHDPYPSPYPYPYPYPAAEPQAPDAGVVPWATSPGDVVVAAPPEPGVVGALPDGDGRRADGREPGRRGTADLGTADLGSDDLGTADLGTADLGADDLGTADLGADDLDLLDSVWTAPRRVSRLTVLLAGGLVATLGFAAGVLVQRHHDAGLVSGSAGGAAAARGLARPNGFGGYGGTPGQADPQGRPGIGGGTAGPGQGRAGPNEGLPGPGPGAGAAAGSSSGTPVLVGTVVSVGPGALVVQNFGGAKVTVRVPAGTPVTTAGLTGLRPGATVSVTGTKASDGTITASTVTSRGKG